jgi:hypothetical protein
MDTSSLNFRFGPFEARTCAQELSKNGTAIRLRGQPFAILDLLLSRAGEVVTREEIRQKLWAADTFVDFEHGLTPPSRNFAMRCVTPPRSPAISKPCRDLGIVSSPRLRLSWKRHQRRQPTRPWIVRSRSPSVNLR